jgi:hypothetical protein
VRINLSASELLFFLIQLAHSMLLSGAAMGKNRKSSIILLYGLVTIVAGASLAYADTVTVDTVTELQEAVASANDSGGNKTILVKDGTYTLTDTLYIKVPNVTITGQSGIRENVVIQGDAMSASAKIGNVIRVSASYFTISNVTLQKSGWHLIQIAGEADADYIVVRNCVLKDSYQQMVKVSQDASNPSVTGDNGLIENSHFEYSAGVGPQYYIGGIDAHGSRNWIVRNNTFQSIISPSDTVAEFAVHFWDLPAANNIVEKNRIVNCDRGIGFGMDGRGNTGGVIRNNMIYHAINAGQFADVGIALIESPDTQVYNNSIFFDNEFPWAVEYRFSSTQNVLIANNLLNKPVMQRDGASGMVSKNVATAAKDWFINPAVGDLHLASAISEVVDAGQIITGLSNDFDGQNRPQGAGIDIGADELSTSSTFQPPKNLRVVN